MDHSLTSDALLHTSGPDEAWLSRQTARIERVANADVFPRYRQELLLAELNVDLPVIQEEQASVVEAQSKHSFYRHFIGAARYFVECARHVEDQALRAAGGSGRLVGESVRHRAYVSGAILSAAAFLEASINELYIELHGGRVSERTRLPRRMLAVLGRFWSDVERAPVLHRYQIVLTVADAERFDERRPPFQDADSLMKLRDALVSCGPERSAIRRRLKTLEQRLHERFPANPLAAADARWFPDLCLSAASAQWAVQAADEFSSHFCTRMALPPRGLTRSEGRARHGRRRQAEGVPASRLADLAARISPNEGSPPVDRR